jgi:hypothetical protein
MEIEPASLGILGNQPDRAPARIMLSQGFEFSP